MENDIEKLLRTTLVFLMVMILIFVASSIIAVSYKLTGDKIPELLLIIMIGSILVLSIYNVIWLIFSIKNPRQ
jgi:hypothetical protein